MSVATPPVADGRKPLIEGRPSMGLQFLIWVFVIGPMIVLIAGAPLAGMAGFGPSWLDIGMFLIGYTITCAGVGVGFHRYLTHGSFKAKRGLHLGLAIAGSLGVEGNVIQWVADHRRHHKFSDVEGDPHSPWRFGESAWGLVRGLLYAHIGWLMKREFSNREVFAPDLLGDKAIRRIDRLFPVWVAVSLGIPAAIGGLVTWSWHGAFTALLWAGIIRMAALHHVTWSINSICHVFGEHTFATHGGDRAANFMPLAIPSFGESWHNLHHADPTLARHGALKGQIDINARLIWLFEKFGWAWDVRWPSQERLAKKLKIAES